jgi:hypothetical protein
MRLPKKLMEKKIESLKPYTIFCFDLQSSKVNTRLNTLGFKSMTVLLTDTETRLIDIKYRRNKRLYKILYLAMKKSPTSRSVTLSSVIS